MMEIRWAVKEDTEEIQKKFAEYLMLEAKKRRIKSIFAQF